MDQNMAKLRHCDELQHGPIIELFPGLQTNSNGPEYLTDEEFAEQVRRQILRMEPTSQPTADEEDLGIPSCDEIAAAMGIATKKPRFKIEMV